MPANFLSLGGGWQNPECLNYNYDPNYYHYLASQYHQQYAVLDHSQPTDEAQYLGAHYNPAYPIPEGGENLENYQDIEAGHSQGSYPQGHEMEYLQDESHLHFQRNYFNEEEYVRL